LYPLSGLDPSFGVGNTDDFLLSGGTDSRKGSKCQGREGVKVDKDYKDL